jgi:excisionase family DNA binding protein
MTSPAGSPATNDLLADGFASLKEAERYLSVGRATLYKLMESGELKWAKFGKCRRIPRAALRDYARHCMVG